MEVLRVYDQNGLQVGYYLIEEEDICKKFCEIYGQSYKREKLFKITWQKRINMI